MANIRMTDLFKTYKSMSQQRLEVVDDALIDEIVEEALFEATAFEIMQDIVKNKQAQKIQGVMVDMFTASVVVQAYDKVNDTNKKRIETSKLDQLVGLAHKVLGMK